jgi:hypothetical protein
MTKKIRIEFLDVYPSPDTVIVEGESGTMFDGPDLPFEDGKTYHYTITYRGLKWGPQPFVYHRGEDFVPHFVGPAVRVPNNG